MHKWVCGFSLFLSACVSPGETMQPWVGHTKSELISEWGNPSRTEPDGKGGEILSFRVKAFPGQNPVNTNHTLGNSYSYVIPQEPRDEAYRQFLVDANGVIYAWQWQE